MPKTSIDRVRARIATLKAAGTPPFEAVMAQAEWDRLKADHWSTRGHVGSWAPNGFEVIGIRVRVISGTRGCALRYGGGVQFEPELGGL